MGSTRDTWSLCAYPEVLCERLEGREGHLRLACTPHAAHTHTESGPPIFNISRKARLLSRLLAEAPQAYKDPTWKR